MRSWIPDADPPASVVLYQSQGWAETLKIAILSLFVRSDLLKFYDILFIVLISSIASMVLACFAAMALTNQATIIL